MQASVVRSELINFIQAGRQVPEHAAVIAHAYKGHWVSPECLYAVALTQQLNVSRSLR